MYRISIIPTRNKPGEYRRAIAAIAGQVDEVITIAHHHPNYVQGVVVPYDREPANISEMWNLGLDAAKTLTGGRPHRVAILNDDAVVAPDWFEQIERAMEQRRVVLGSGLRETPGNLTTRLCGYAFVVQGDTIRADERWRWWASDDHFEQEAQRRWGGWVSVPEARVRHLHRELDPDHPLVAAARADLAAYRQEALATLTYQPVIMHGVDNPERADRVRLLQRVFPTAPVVRNDPTYPSPLGTFRSALETAHRMQPEAEWIVVLQDDANPLPGAVPHLQQALAVAPEPVVGLSYGGLPNRMPITGSVASFQVGMYTTQGGAFALHRSLVDAGLLQWLAPLLMVDGYQHDDGVFAAFAWWLGYRTSCVTHALFVQDLPSTFEDADHLQRMPPPWKTIGPNVPRVWRPWPIEERTFGTMHGPLASLLLEHWDRQVGIVPTRRSRAELEAVVRRIPPRIGTIGRIPAIV